MADRGEAVSVALETTSHAGGVALGAGDVLIEALPFDTSRRAATQVLVYLDDLLARHDLTPQALTEVYVDVGPGSFTGTRIAVTVARMLGRAVGRLRCVAVGAPAVVAEAARADAGVEHLAVVLDARDGRIYAAVFERAGDQFMPAAAPAVTTVEALLASTPRPLHVTGEGLGYHAVAGPGVVVLDEGLWLPSVDKTWAVGRRLAVRGRFTAPAELLPVYTGQPKAVRLWERDRGGST